MLSPMTDLQAVNRMLKSIGQAPVNTLEVSGIGDVNKAKQELDEVTRDVQTVGWSWNTDYSYQLTPDASGIITVPLGALDVDPTDSTSNVVVRRHPSGVQALWDVDNQTFTFADPVLVDIIWGFPFNELPSPARTYIATAAARRFQAQTVSSPILDRYNQEDEDRAWTLLKQRERGTRDTNLFRANRTLGRFYSRRRLG